MFKALIPTRSVEEIIGGQLRIQLGSTTYVLPELAMDPTDRWAATIDERIKGLLAIVDGMDEEAGVLALFSAAMAFQDEMLATLLAYDEQHVLPPAEEIRKSATHTQLMFALVGVWASSKSPLAATVMAVLGALPETPTGTAPAPISRSRGNARGVRAKRAAA